MFGIGMSISEALMDLLVVILFLMTVVTIIYLIVTCIMRIVFIRDSGETKRTELKALKSK